MKWRLHAKVSGGKYLGEVEADTKEEAEEAALDLESAGVSLCHYCSGECEDIEIERVTAEAVEEAPGG